MEETYIFGMRVLVADWMPADKAMLVSTKETPQGTELTGVMMVNIGMAKEDQESEEGPKISPIAEN